MTRTRPKPALAAGLLVTVWLCTALPQPTYAQAPAADKYEENDSLAAAGSIPSTITLPGLTIYPARDPDFFRFVASAGPLMVRVIGTPGLDLTLNIYGPAGTIIATANDPAGANASVTLLVPTTAYYIIEVNSETQLEGFYDLQVANAPATPTPIPTVAPTPTAAPYTATPELGGPPDRAEPNPDFAHAFRIVPGDKLENLNFNSGTPGAQDNDFFVMAVRAGVTYTCQTDDLGPSLDTNLIVYHSANTNDLVGGNDDVDTQAGKINSRLTFTARTEGDVYLLVGYKYVNGMVYPGQATYTLTCFTGAPAAAPGPSPGSAGGGSGAAASAPLISTPLSILTLLRPQPTPSPTARPAGTLTIDVLAAYDVSANGQPEPAEGIAGLSVWVINASTGQELTHGYTDTTGAAHFTIATTSSVRVSIPYLAEMQEFQANSPGRWVLLIPAAKVPGLIP